MKNNFFNKRKKITSQLYQWISAESGCKDVYVYKLAAPCRNSLKNGCKSFCRTILRIRVKKMYIPCVEYHHFVWVAVAGRNCC